MANADTPGDQDINSILASIRRIVVDEPTPVTPDMAAGADLTAPRSAPTTPLELDESLLDPGPESLEPPLIATPAVATSAAPATAGDPTTLEAAVRAALQPMLREWLDANLSRLVTEALDKATQAEIRRLTGAR